MPATKLECAALVPRDDGRFYIPLKRTAIRPNDDRSTTVLRVASDAFDSVAEARCFAVDVCAAYNSVIDSQDPAFRRLASVLARCAYPGFVFDFTIKGGVPMMRVHCPKAVCNVTGADISWNGRWWTMSKWMVDTEIVATAWKATFAAIEHEARELFTFDEVTLFDPHMSVAKLVELRRQPDALDERTPP